MYPNPNLHTWVSTSTGTEDRRLLTKAEASALNAAVYFDPEDDDVVLFSDPIRDGSDRLLGTHITVTEKTWERAQQIAAENCACQAFPTDIAGAADLQASAMDPTSTATRHPGTELGR